MRIESGSTDAAILTEIGRRLHRLRLDLNQSQEAVAQEAGVHVSTLVRCEAGQPSTLVNLVRICRALGIAGNFDALVPAPAPSPIALLDRAGRPRVRARRKRTQGPPAGAWHWGDET